MSAEGNFFRRRRVAENDAIFVKLCQIRHNSLITTFGRRRNDSFDTYGGMTLSITQFRNNHDLFLFQMTVMRGKLMNRIEIKRVCRQLLLKHYVQNII